MAAQRKKASSGASGKNRSAAYRYRVEGSAAVQPEPIPQTRPHRRQEEITRPRVRPKRRSQKNLEKARQEQLRVRVPEAIAPLSVIGMLAVVVLAVVILQYRIQLNTLNNEVVSAVAQLEELQETEEQLQAQYEQLFDMQSIESDMLNSGKMITPSESQQIYLDLSEPDETVTYNNSPVIITWFQGILEKITALLE